jgi:hypothetical protein
MNAPLDPARASETPVCPSADFLSLRFKVWTTVLFISLSFALGSVPFLIAEHKTPPNQVFLGQVNNYPDYSMYFSFVRQSYDGKWLFNNTETFQPSRRIIVNLEWLGLGKIMRVFHLSENSLLQLWRFLGAVSLIGGFAFLAANFPLSRRRWLLALALFSLGGGFGFLASVAAAAHLVAPTDFIRSLSVDMWGNLHPFQVIMGNPHAAVATGITLFGFGLFLISERKQSFWFSGLSGLTVGLCGFIRPYDLISLTAILSVFALVETVLNGFSFPKTARRLLPIVIILPVLAYNIWVFKFDPVYKYWGTQNHNSTMLPHFWVYYLAFGLPGLLALNRILQLNFQPFSLAERFLTVWLAVVFGIVYAGTVVPALSFSPQIGYSLIAPLVLLGLLLIRFNRLPPNFTLKISPVTALVMAGLMVAFANLGTIGFYSLKFFSGKTFQPLHRLEVYADRGELEAWRWMDGHLPKDRLIMGLPHSCNVLSKYTSLRVVDGHWSVTPHYYELSTRLHDFYSSPVLGADEKNLLQEFQPDYLYFGPDERQVGGGELEKLFAAGLVYQNELVSVYQLNLIKDSTAASLPVEK